MHHVPVFIFQATALTIFPQNKLVDVPASGKFIKAFSYNTLHQHF
jgi:hypothetical protein